jgi:hypothetical protein
MSDNPQSERQRSRLLNEQKTLIKAQNHLQRLATWALPARGGGSVMNTGLDRDLGGLSTPLLFVSSDGVLLLLFLL